MQSNIAEIRLKTSDESHDSFCACGVRVRKNSSNDFAERSKDSISKNAQSLCETKLEAKTPLKALRGRTRY
jgi:hypothetical protein